MQDKAVLINSMNNLINHISISRKNQQQMFASLTRKDFDKIFSNLQDTLLKLRITTVKLLSQLLYSNSALKQKFCQLMDIQFYYSSNIVLNNNMQKLLLKYPKKQKELFLLLKQQCSGNSSNGPKSYLLWFINLKKQKLTVEYIQRQQLAMITNLTTNKNINFDPLDSIFGISIQSSSEQQQVESRTQASSSIISETSKLKSGTKSIELDSYQPNSHSKQIYQQQPYHFPVSVKNTTFTKSSNSKVGGNYSFNKGYTGYSQVPSQLKSNTSRSIKNQQYVLSSTPTNIQTQPWTTISKKQNEQIILSNQKDKYSNRLSLQLHDMKGYRKNNTSGQAIANPSHVIRIQNTSHIQSTENPHYQGLKLMTPRQSLKNTQKISIVNNGSYTQRSSLNHEDGFLLREKQKFNQFNANESSSQKVKTIHLGKGTKAGIQVTRYKKNQITQRY